MVGSGPFRFLPDERVSGARNAYAKFDKYVPREGVASFCAGPRIANFDRVEWLTTPDPSTQAAALKAGEVDWVEQPVMDLVPSLKADRNLRVEVVETTGPDRRAAVQPSVSAVRQPGDPPRGAAGGEPEGVHDRGRRGGRIRV